MSCSNHLPYFVEGAVVTGFRRGSKELGIPTANFPQDVVERLPEAFGCGVYYGWASVDGIGGVHQMVLSVGWNDFYGNEVKTMETHVMHKFDQDFYGRNLRIIILGFIRPMTNFDSLDALIRAIHNDMHYAGERLMTSGNIEYKDHSFFKSSTVIPTSKGKQLCYQCSISPCHHIDSSTTTMLNPSINGPSVNRESGNASDMYFNEDENSLSQSHTRKSGACICVRPRELLQRVCS